MSAVCLLDTSIFVHLLNIPGMGNKKAEIQADMGKKLESGEQFFLPLAAVLETSNHIGHIKEESRRVQCATLFVKQVKQALAGTAPFKPVQFFNEDIFTQWLDEFPQHARKGRGIGDMSIVKDWNLLCERYQGQRVYVWSLDKDLIWCDRAPLI